MAEIEVSLKTNKAAIKRASTEAITRALEEMGMKAEKYAKLIVPVDTGNLRNSITHAADVGSKTMIVGTNVEYAPYVEMGTRRSAPHPYLEPAISEHIDEYYEVLEKHLKNG